MPVQAGCSMLVSEGRRDMEEKKGRGRPPASLKPDARRIAMKLRWTVEEIEAVRLAAYAAGEDVSHFIRSAALARCRKKTR